MNRVLEYLVEGSDPYRCTDCSCTSRHSWRARWERSEVFKVLRRRKWKIEARERKARSLQHRTQAHNGAKCDCPPVSWVDHLYAITPTDLPFLSLIGRPRTAEEQEKMGDVKQIFTWGIDITHTDNEEESNGTPAA